MRIKLQKSRSLTYNSKDISSGSQLQQSNIAEIKIQEIFQPVEEDQKNLNKITPIFEQNHFQTVQYKEFVRAQYRESNIIQQITIESRILDFKESEQLIFKNARIQKKNDRNEVIKIKNNETKNIAKNYGKAIIAFMLSHKKILKLICKETSTPYQRLIQQIYYIKHNLITICGFRKIWTDYRYARCMRMISSLFLRKHSLEYIFNSKIINLKTHIKYRNTFIDGLYNPQEFNHIKQF